MSDQGWEERGQFEAVMESIATLDANRIAAWLVENEAYGFRGSCTECALAIFLSGAAGHEVSITEDEDEPLRATVWCCGTRILYDLPESAVEFVRRFDRGEYPKLDFDQLAEAEA